MRIAYISFEYPPDSAFGGIATYVRQAALLMKSRGHEVEVFCASPTRTVSENFEGIMVNRLQSDSRETFSKDIVPLFTERHKLINFQVMESPEYFADGYDIKMKFPGVGLVVKLHTPQFFIYEMTKSYVPWFAKFRFLFGGLRRFKFSQPYWKWKPKKDDVDYRITMLADQVHTPSIDLGNIVSRRWKINRRKILNVPNLFVPNKEFTSLPIGSDSKVVTYIGRLEVRKGLVSLTEAVPLILKDHPDAIIQFVGKTLPSHVEGLTMKEYIARTLEPYRDNIQFLEAQWNQIPAILSGTAVCVFPSIWENFPNVCLESMSAGRAIVGSKNGGMSDMLGDTNAGILIDPLSPTEIAAAVSKLLADKNLRSEMGARARKKVLTDYSGNVIGNLMEEKYSQLAK